MKGQVTILAEPHDDHLPLITPYLDNPVVINPLAHDSDEQLTYRGSEVTYAPIIVHRRNLLGCVGSVWVRTMPLASNPLASALLYVLPNCRWVSAPLATIRAHSLPYQQMMARRAGLIAPPTLITASPNEMAAFLQRYHTCVVQPYDDGRLADLNPGAKHVWTEGTTDLSGVGGTPFVLQSIRGISHEVRAVVVGEKVFAATVADFHPDTLRAPDAHDWRTGLRRGTFLAHEKILPERITNSLQRLVRCCGLTMAVIDVAVDRRGEYAFLSLLPTGDWNFIQAATGQPISRTVARLLQR